jgi:predicted  nucleic acid-binding Zn-ribbon protein
MELDFYKSFYIFIIKNKKMEKQVLTQEEIQKLTELKSQFNELVNVVGNVEIQIMDLQLKKEQLKSSLQSLQQQEIAIAKELEDKYGQGSISLETGEFLPSN